MHLALRNTHYVSFIVHLRQMHFLKQKCTASVRLSMFIFFLLLELCVYVYTEHLIKPCPNNILNLFIKLRFLCRKVQILLL